MSETKTVTIQPKVVHIKTNTQSEDGHTTLDNAFDYNQRNLGGATVAGMTYLEL